MKRIAVLILCSLVSFAGMAQRNYPHEPGRIFVHDPIFNDVGVFELDAAVGITGGRFYDPGIPVTGVQGLIEARFNFSGTPFDIGIQGSMGKFNRNAKEWNGIKGYSRNRGTVVGFFDYNVRGRMGIDGFCGIGLGSSSCEYCYPVIKDGSSVREKDFCSKLVLNPRIGMEIANIVRITGEYKMMLDRRFSYFALNIGLTLGGRPRYYVEERPIFHGR